MTARKYPLLPQLAWAATLATGFIWLWSVPALGLGAWIQQAWQHGRWNVPPAEVLVVSSDGTPLIRTFPRENYPRATYRDLKGGVRNAAESDDLLPPVSLAATEKTPGFFSSRIGWDQRVIRFMNEQEPTVQWYFVDDGKLDGAGYFVGYDSENNRRVGFIGLAGFRSTPVPVDEWIPVLGTFIDYSAGTSRSFPTYSGRGWAFRVDRRGGPPRWIYVPSRNQLRKIDLAARTVATVFETPEPIESADIPVRSGGISGHTMMEQPILVRTRQHIHVLDHKHNVIRVFDIPAEVDIQSPAYWYEIGNAQAIVDFVQPGSGGIAENVTRRKVYRIGDDGAIRDRFELTLQTGMPVLDDKQIRAFRLALCLPVPAIVFVVDLTFAIAIDQFRSYPAAVTSVLKDSGPSLMAILALSTILAIMAWRRSLMFGFSRREQVVWAVFVLLFGIPAYAGFLLYHRWPTRQPCPNCHAQAPRDRGACAACGTRFPDPPLKGIEIFA